MLFCFLRISISGFLRFIMITKTFLITWTNFSLLTKQKCTEHQDIQDFSIFGGTALSLRAKDAGGILKIFAKKFPVKDTAAYCTAQFVGASLGAGLIILVMGMDALTSGGLGMTAPAVGISVFQAVLAEFIGTFILMMVIMGVAVDRRAVSGFAGLAIGASVLAVILVIGKISGGSINPARTFGPDLMALIFSGSDALWTTFPIYVIGPILGAVCAALLYCKMAGKDNC